MRATIALVNDDEDFLELLTELLESEGYRATCHVDGMAWTSLRRERPDLILLDLRPQRRDETWALLERLRGDPALAALPIIVCSADYPFLQERAARLRGLGCATIAKPFDLDELLDLIATALAPSDRAVD